MLAFKSAYSLTNCFPKFSNSSICNLRAFLSFLSLGFLSCSLSCTIESQISFKATSYLLKICFSLRYTAISALSSCDFACFVASFKSKTWFPLRTSSNFFWNSGVWKFCLSKWRATSLSSLNLRSLSTSSWGTTSLIFSSMFLAFSAPR